MNTALLIPYVDVHAAGQPGRVLTASHLLASGKTMAQRLEYARTNLDWLRQLVLHEPRGYPAMCAVLITGPCDPRADVGLIVLEQGGFKPMSGSNAMCAVTALIETGAFPATEPLTTIVLDTAVGLVHVTASVRAGKVTQVSVRNVPAFVEVLDFPLDVPHLGVINVDVVFGGQYYVQARAADARVPLLPSAGKAIARAGALIRTAARQQIPVKHPDNPDINQIDLVMLHGPTDTPGASARNAVILCSEDVSLDAPDTWTGTLDRSPCGTGTSGRMAAKHARGELPFGAEFVHESITGSLFTGYLEGAVDGHARGAVRPMIAGAAWITGVGYLALDPSDPYPQGFTLGDLWAQ